MFLVCLCVCLPNVSKLGYNYLKYSFCGQNPDTIFCFRKDATAAVGVWVTSACSPFEPFAPSKIAKTVNKTRNRNYTNFFLPGAHRENLAGFLIHFHVIYVCLIFLFMPFPCKFLVFVPKNIRSRKEKAYLAVFTVFTM